MTDRVLGTRTEVELKTVKEGRTCQGTEAGTTASGSEDMMDEECPDWLVVLSWVACSS